MIGSLPPGSLLLLGALLLPLLRGRVRQAWGLLLPLLSMAQLMQLTDGQTLTLQFMDYELTPIRVDKLSLAFGYVFHLAAFLGIVFSLHVKDRVEQVAALVYMGAAVGAAFAGDLMTLFVFWELTAVASVFIVWAGRTERAYRAGMRYLIFQVGSGVLLLSGILVHCNAGGSLEFGRLTLGSPGALLIFLAFGIKCAFPLLHNWLPDAYPEASPTGAVFLSGFTTKLAIYAMARAFPGSEILIWIGVTMALFSSLYALIENDLRRVLAYSLNGQLGFMIVGVGVGSELALNGTVSHAFASTLYKALLFMSMGAVLHRTGTARASELGGLFRSMPWTAGFCLVGAASVSAFPLFSGFVTKSMVLSGAAYAHHAVVYLLLIFASAAAFLHTGIRVPFLAFFSRDAGIRCKEAPVNMLLAMGATAALCVAIGCFPDAIYSLMPFPVDYHPYTASHVVTQLQLLLFSGLAYALLQRAGLFPAAIASQNLDSDWIYRRLLPRAYASSVDGAAWARERLASASVRGLRLVTAQIYRYHGPGGAFSRTLPTGTTVLVVAVLLSAFLLAYLF